MFSLYETTQINPLFTILLVVLTMYGLISMFLVSGLRRSKSNEIRHEGLVPEKGLTHRKSYQNTLSGTHWKQKFAYSFNVTQLTVTALAVIFTAGSLLSQSGSDQNSIGQMLAALSIALLVLLLPFSFIANTLWMYSKRLVYTEEQSLQSSNLESRTRIKKYRRTGWALWWTYTSVSGLAAVVILIGANLPY